MKCQNCTFPFGIAALSLGNGLLVFIILRISSTVGQRHEEGDKDAAIFAFHYNFTSTFLMGCLVEYREKSHNYG